MNLHFLKNVLLMSKMNFFQLEQTCLNVIYVRQSQIYYIIEDIN